MQKKHGLKWLKTAENAFCLLPFETKKSVESVMLFEDKHPNLMSPFCVQQSAFNRFFVKRW